MAPPKRAVCLLSGGMDSAVTMAEAHLLGRELYALSFDYGQRHACELSAASAVATALGAREHRTVSLDLRALGGSALTGGLDVPKGRSHREIGSGVPVTYVPARNAVFLSIALGWAEVLDAHEIFIGVNTLDYSGYPDCRPEFLQAFEEMAAVATAAGAEKGRHFSVEAPLMHLDKGQIVRRARELGVDLGLTHTCYDPIESTEQAGWLACGQCDACKLRLKGFQAAGLVDPVSYS